MTGSLTRPLRRFIAWRRSSGLWPWLALAVSWFGLTWAVVGLVDAWVAVVADLSGRPPLPVPTWPLWAASFALFVFVSELGVAFGVAALHLSHRSLEIEGARSGVRLEYEPGARSGRIVFLCPPLSALDASLALHAATASLRQVVGVELRLDGPLAVVGDDGGQPGEGPAMPQPVDVRVSALHVAGAPGLLGPALIEARRVSLLAVRGDSENVC